MDAKRVHFAVDAGGTGLVNLQGKGLAGLHIIGPGNLAYLVKGKARKLKDRIAAVAPSERLFWELDVLGARDQSFPGATAKPFTSGQRGRTRAKRHSGGGHALRGDSPRTGVAL